MGGENLDNPDGLPEWTGSSPRGRGKPLGGGIRARSHRLIPAWAGKTPRVIVVATDVGAHPRVGGENIPGARPAYTP